MKNILIIGCGLLGSSLLRRISKKKIAKKIKIEARDGEIRGRSVRFTPKGFGKIAKTNFLSASAEFL